jgi:hypothetical protein
LRVEDPKEEKNPQGFFDRSAGSKTRKRRMSEVIRLATGEGRVLLQNLQGSSTSAICISMGSSDPKEENLEGHQTCEWRRPSGLRPNPSDPSTSAELVIKGKNRFVRFRIHFIINKWCLTDRN